MTALLLDVIGGGARGSVPSWTPGQLVGLDVWLDASDGPTITDDGGGTNVVSILDLSGNMRSPVQATASLRPATGVASINGLNALRFATTDYLAFSPYARTQPFAVFLVGSVRALTDYVSMFDLSDGSFYGPQLTTAFGGANDWLLYAGAAALTGATPVVDAVHAMVAVFDGANSALWIDGVQVGGSLNPGTLGTAAIRVGGTWDGALADIDLGEFAIAAPPDVMTLGRFFTYSSAKWATIGGSGAGWTPAAITTGWWADASDVASITQSGGLVSKIAAQDASGVDLVQASGPDKPQTGVDTINGLNVLSMPASEWVNLNITPIAQPVTLLLVVQRTAADMTFVDLGPAPAAGPQLGYFPGTVAGWAAYAGNTVGFVPAPDTAAHAVALILAGSASKLYVDGNLLGTVDAGTLGVDGIRIGGAWDGGLSAMLFGEGAIATGVLGPIDLAGWFTYAHDKWGTTNGGGGGDPGDPGDPGGGPTPTPGDIATGVAASDITAWLSIGDAYASDSDLDEWVARSIKRVVLVTNALYGFGGSYAFTSAASPTFDGGDGRTGPQWQYHAQIKNSNIVARAASRGITMILGHHMNDLDGVDGSPVPGDWFDDTHWNRLLSHSLDGQGLAEFAAAAKNLGMRGIGYDPEAAPQNGGGQGSWKWNYPLNTHSQAQVRTAAFNRGVQTSLIVHGVTGFPGGEFYMYLPTSQDLRHGWTEDYNAVNAGDGGVYGNGTVLADNVVDDFLNGFWSVTGYGKVYLGKSIFYKPGNLGGPSGRVWKAMIRYDVLNTFARISREYARPDILLPLLRITPFTWFDAGEGTGEYATDPGSAQQEAVDNNRVGMETWWLYAQHWDDGYATWKPALAAGAVTSSPSGLLPSINGPQLVRSGSTVVVSFVGSHAAYGMSYAQWIVYDTDGTTVLNSGTFHHTFAIGSKVYDVDDGYTDATYPATVTLPSANVPVGGSVQIIAHTPLGQQHSLPSPLAA